MTEEDAEVAPRARRRGVRLRARRRDLPDPARRVRPRRLRRASTTWSRTRCCGSSSTTSGTSRTRRTSASSEVDAYEQGYCVVNDDLADAVLEEIEGDEDAVVMLHDYHLYTAPQVHPRGAPRRLPAPLRPHPVDPARRLAGAAARHARGHLRGHPRPTTSSPSTRAPTGATSCSAAASCSTSRSTRRPGIVHFDGPRGVGARLPAADLGRDLPAQRPAARGARVRARDPAPPARAPDPARRPRRPVEERAARLHRLRPVPRAAPRVPASRSRSSPT